MPTGEGDGRGPRHIFAPESSCFRVLKASEWQDKPVEGAQAIYKKQNIMLEDDLSSAKPWEFDESGLAKLGNLRQKRCLSGACYLIDCDGAKAE